MLRNLLIGYLIYSLFMSLIFLFAFWRFKTKMKKQNKTRKI